MCTLRYGIAGNNASIFFLTFKEFGFKYIKKTEVPLQKAFADEVLPNWKEFGRKDTLS